MRQGAQISLVYLLSVLPFNFMRYLLFLLLVVSANAQPTPLGPVREGPVSVIPMGNGNNSGNSATNVVLSGQIIKGASSTSTVIAAGGIGTSNIANSQITAALMANDLDTNVFSAAGFQHLLSLVQGGSQTPWGSDINANNKALTNLNYISGAVASSNALMVQNASGTAVLQSRTNGDLVISGKYYGDGSSISNVSVYSSNILSAVLTWGGPSNSIVVYNGFSDWYYASSTPVSVTNLTGIISGYNLTADLRIKNTSGSTFTNFCTIPNATYVGQNGNNQATNAITIAAGKKGLWHFESDGSNWTNVYSTVEQ